MKRFFLLALFVSTGIAMSACQPAEPWAARVNDATITADQVISEFNATLSNPVYRNMENVSLGGDSTRNALQPGGENTMNASYVAQIISGRIILESARQELGRLNLQVTPEYQQRASGLLRQQFQDPNQFDSLDVNFREYVIERTASLLLLLDARNAPQHQQEYYNTHANELSTSCVRHILVTTQEEARSVKQRIAAGQDFAAIAREVSIDNDSVGGSAQKGGDLGCFTPDQLLTIIESFRNEVTTLSVNQLSEPIKTSLGFHLIQVTSRTLLPFEQVQPVISQRLGDPSVLINDVVGAARVEVNPRYGVYTPPNKAAGTDFSVQPHRPVQLKSDDGSNGQSPLPQFPVIQNQPQH